MRGLSASPAVGALSRPRARGHLGRAEIAISARRLAGRPPAAQRGSAVGLVDLDIVRGQITVIAGAPGSGKSALLRLLAGIDRPRAGTVWVGERLIDAGTGRSGGSFRREDLVYIPAPRGMGVGAREILRSLAPEPGYAFLDEPARDAGVGGLDRVHGALYALTAIRGGTVVVATSRPEVAAWADRLLVLDRGALVLDLETPTVAETASALRPWRTA